MLMTSTRRLIRKFFVESRAAVHLDRTMRVCDLVNVLSWTTYFEDFSCKAAPFLESPPDLGRKE